jgi:hypothetical protein
VRCISVERLSWPLDEGILEVDNMTSINETHISAVK